MNNSKIWNYLGAMIIIWYVLYYWFTWYQKDKVVTVYNNQNSSFINILKGDFSQEAYEQFKDSTNIAQKDVCNYLKNEDKEECISTYKNELDFLEKFYNWTYDKLSEEEIDIEMKKNMDKLYHNVSTIRTILTDNGFEFE